jgi:hypothetical protein|uniref:Uncharacterized protein n=1 Tax=uncultured organism TaxID=155900 RepID=M1P207_9ZZZZ|nr:hypothetical protein FLSS-25_0027 [uncultured organism]
MTFFRVAGDKDCEHDSLEYLGSDAGNNEFFRCKECGGIIIKKGKIDKEAERKKTEVKDKSLIEQIFGWEP